MISLQTFYRINLFQVTLVHTVTIMLRILGLNCRDSPPAATARAAATSSAEATARAAAATGTAAATSSAEAAGIAAATSSAEATG
jgi:hypothetical protein